MVKQESSHAGRKGFTLIEMLVVISIIGVLAGVLVPSISSAMCSSKASTSQLMMNDLETALSSYKQDFGLFPEPSGEFDSGPLFDALGCPKGRGKVYYEFQDQHVYQEGKSIGSGDNNFDPATDCGGGSESSGTGGQFKYMSPVSPGVSSYEIHYTVPRKYWAESKYDSVFENAEPSGQNARPGQMNYNGPNLWTMDCNKCPDGKNNYGAGLEGCKFQNSGGSNGGGSGE